MVIILKLFIYVLCVILFIDVSECCFLCFDFENIFLVEENVGVRVLEDSG